MRHGGLTSGVNERRIICKSRLCVFWIPDLFCGADLEFWEEDDTKDYDELKKNLREFKGNLINF
ncbi:hypothetical protein DMO16_14830 [Fictibacillus sp. S7]|nr:hypothetical protein DMO16_14830 [Fictibacillus sp. S7]